jgi:hypothetical protein
MNAPPTRKPFRGEPSAEARVFAHFQLRYGISSMDEVEVDSTPGYWRRRLPCNPATCRSPYHNTPGCGGEPVQHTLFFSEPESYERGRLLSPYRAWEDLRARKVLRRTMRPHGQTPAPTPESQAASGALEAPPEEAPPRSRETTLLQTKHVKEAWQRASVSLRFIKLVQSGSGPHPESPEARGWYLPTAWKSWEALPGEVRDALLALAFRPKSAASPWAQPQRRDRS